MRVFLLSLDLDLWNIVENDFQTPKPRSEWNELKKKSFSLNAKAMNVLFCALNKTKFNCISTCKTTFNIWRTLKITYEGTSRVKNSKINLLMYDFEFFQMAPSETIGNMYTHFTDVVNSLKSLAKCFSNVEIVNKILRSLPKRWDPKVIAIQEAKDLNDLPIEELIDSLITYEISFFELDEYENHLPKNKKDLELRTKEYHLSDNSSDDDDDDLGLFTIKFNKFIK
ncbi:unnamed protein product [Musa textilis]